MLDSTLYLSYDIKVTFISHFSREENVILFVIMYAALLWTSQRFPKICKPLVVYQFILHGVISLQDTKSYNKHVLIMLERLPVFLG